jgi:hypothetical protein
MHGVAISLLHATYHSGTRAVIVRDAWLSLAEQPGRIEHIFSLDDDDIETLSATEGFRRVVNPALPGVVTSVRNWNAAATSARGDLLFVIADDLFPPSGWDTQLLTILRTVDRRRNAFAVKLNDNGAGDVLLRHPVVSRRFYERFGLFNSAFQGVYCDDDLTRRAFRNAVIIDGRSLVLDHKRHSSESTDRLNSHSEYEYGIAAFEARWQGCELDLQPILADAAQLSTSTLDVARLRLRAKAYKRLLVRKVRHLVS